MPSLIIARCCATFAARSGRDHLGRRQHGGTDPNYLPSFKDEWARCVAGRPVGADVVQWWLPHAKPTVRRHAAKFTREWRRQCKNRLSFLYELLQDLVTATPRPAEYAGLIRETKAEILEMHALKLQGVKQRAALDTMLQDSP